MPFVALQISSSGIYTMGVILYQKRCITYFVSLTLYDFICITYFCITYTVYKEAQNGVQAEEKDSSNGR
jgi:hypothetical protein